MALIGAFALMYFFGFTINTLTLLAMVLAIGLVVDDAIVVLENIFRQHRGRDGPRRQAAIQGAKEIGFRRRGDDADAGGSVFAPLAFATGRTGRLFIEFALTLAGAVIVSGFVALTLSPMMCSQAAAARGRSTPEDLHDFDRSAGLGGLTQRLSRGSLDCRAARPVAGSW